MESSDFLGWARNWLRTRQSMDQNGVLLGAKQNKAFETSPLDSADQSLLAAGQALSLYESGADE